MVGLAQSQMIGNEGESLCQSPSPHVVCDEGREISCLLRGQEGQDSQK